MGLFSASSPLDPIVEQATSEKNTTDDWAKIVDVCDKINNGSTGVVDGMKAINKRLKHENPRVQLQTITLLDACISNCGRNFLLKVSEREFEQELSKLLTCARTHHKVSEKLRECLKKWAEGDFHRDPQLALIPALYMKLQQQGYNFDVQIDSPKQQKKFSTDPNVVDSQQEEDDIAKAIQLSLQETGSSSFKSKNHQSIKKDGDLYPSASTALSDFSSIPEKEPMKVRALYDFEAVEDNELTFKTGEIIVVSNSNDPNWWEGTNHRGKGLFPSNFVTDNLYEEDEKKIENSMTKKVSFSESVEVTEVPEDFSLFQTTGEINEENIDKLLHILHEADPTAERPDDPALPHLEEQVNAMAPTIDVELEKIDRMHAQLARISTDLVGGLSLYHQLLRDTPPQLQHQYYSQFNPMHHNMVSSNATDIKPPHYMHPVGMPHMYPQPNHLPPYVGMPVADHSYNPPHTQQSDLSSIQPHSLPPSDYPPVQSPASYPGQPAQVNYAQYPYGATANGNFDSPIYSQPHSAIMPQPMGPYQPPMHNVMDPPQNTVVSSTAPGGVVMSNQIPPMHFPGHMIPGHIMPQYANNIPPVQPTAISSMPPAAVPNIPPASSASHQPSAMQQPLL